MGWMLPLSKAFAALLLCQTAFGAGFTISAGNNAWGGHNPALATPLSVTITGTQTTGNQERSFVYNATDNEAITIALTPGIHGSCSGPCNVFTMDSIGGGAFSPSGTGFPANGSLGNFYFVDPIFNTTATTSGAISLFANLPDPDSSDLTSTATNSLATRFHSDRNGFIVGLRFFRPASDTATGQVGSLWSDSGTALANVTFSPSGGGWQTAFFSSAVAITAGTVYRIGYQTTGTVYYRPNYFKTYSYVGNQMHSEAWFVSSNGACNTTDSWPKNAEGDTAAGMIACIDIASNGSISTVTGADTYASAWLGAEGTNFMVGSNGPGPYMVLNTFIECVGNCWHHSNEGYDIRYRSSYTYKRNIFQAPKFSRPLWAGGDGNRYSLRQLWETKGAERLYFEGNTFQYAFNDVGGNSLTIAFANVQGEGVRDVDMNYNEFAHIPGGIVGPSMYTTGDDTFPIAPPPNRYRYRNMLIWDIGPRWNMGGTNDGNGWLFLGISGAEDFILDHITVVGNTGRVPVILDYYDSDSEVFATNSIFYIDSSRWGAIIEGSVAAPSWASCPSSLSGEALLKCKNPNYLTWANNLLFPNTSTTVGNADASSGTCNSGSPPCTWGSNATQSSVRTNWPTLYPSNIVPNTVDLNDIGWWKLNADKSGDFRLKNSSPYISGGANKANDGSDLGVDMQGLRDAQGYVTLTGVSNASISCATTCAATVAFVAPDAQACPVDISSTDSTLINSFTRTTDSGTGRVRNVALSGLARNTTYYYRVDCAAQQPTGQFRTR